jgi:hypothetical protein
LEGSSVARASKGDRVLMSARALPELAARVDAFAKETGADRGEAMCELIRRGLGDDVRAAAVAEAVGSGSDGLRAAAAASRRREKPSTSAPVQAVAAAVSKYRPTPGRRVIGFDAVTGAPLFREG